MRGSRLILVALLVATACSPDRTPAESGVTVVATTSVWADVARHIVADDGTVDTVIPAGADAHDYQPSTRQIADLHTADLVVANGLGLEAGLADALRSSIAEGANVVELGPALDPLPFADEASADHGLDPHVWFDPLRVAEAAHLIADRLETIDPGIDWQQRADAYEQALLAADGEIEDTLAVVPNADRKLVTNHDALGYFADRYGFEVVGVVIPGGSTLADPSSSDLAELVATIRVSGVKAIFSEASHPARLAEAVAAEVGTDVAVIELFTESVGESGSGADSLIEMLSTNARRVAEGLG